MLKPSHRDLGLVGPGFLSSIQHHLRDFSHVTLHVFWFSLCKTACLLGCWWDSGDNSALETIFTRAGLVIDMEADCRH